jgi:hypothetical protein
MRDMEYFIVAALGMPKSMPIAGFLRNMDLNFTAPVIHYVPVILVVSREGKEMKENGYTTTKRKRDLGNPIP